MDLVALSVFIVLFVTCFVGLPVAVETLTRGRSVGKLALGLRVVRDDGGSAATPFQDLKDPGDGLTGRYDSFIRWKHLNRVLSGSFLDGHAKLVSMLDWDRVDQDGQGYYYRIAAADR